MFTGLVLTIVLLVQLSRSWDEDPVLHVIENPTASVLDIPFPAVTICPHEHQTDNWALPEKLLNAFEFEEWSVTVDRSLSNAIRTTLKPFFEAAARSFGDALQSNHIFFTGNDVRANLSRAFRCRHESIQDKVIDFMAENVGLRISDEDLLKTFENVCDGLDSVDKGQGYHSYPLEKALSVMLTLFHLKGGISSNRLFPPLGNFLKTFASEIGPHSLGLNENTDADYLLEETDICDNFTEAEIALQNLFIELTPLIVGEFAKNVSLFELPSLLEPPAVQVRGQNYNNVRYYPYTHCKVKDILENSPTQAWCYYAYSNWINPIAADVFDYYRHPCECEQEHYRGCCDWRNIISKWNLTGIMKVMKHARRLNAKHSSIFDDFPEALKMFPMKHTGPLNDNDDLKYIFNCQFADVKPIDGGFLSTCRAECFACDKFYTIPTTEGVCYAFNVNPIKDTYEPSAFTEAFQAAFADDMPPSNATLFHGLGGDDNLGLFFVLDRQDMLRSPKAARGSFEVAINSAEESYNVRTEVVGVEFGHETEILVTPTQHTASNNLRSLDITSRGCRFPDEKPEGFTLFRNYSRIGCLYECLLRQSEAKCRCSPWNFPSFEPQRFTCDLFGSYCFREAFRDISLMRNCECADDCERTAFTLSSRSRPIKVEEKCAIFNGDLHKNIFYRRPNLHPTTHVFNSIKNLEYREVIGKIPLGDSSLDWQTKICKEAAVNDFAFVRVRFARGTFTRTQKRPTNTFSSKVASFGGTLGLFTGMSFLSLVEVIFWPLKAMWDAGLRRVKRQL